jgi:hypothetical protein
MVSALRSKVVACVLVLFSFMGTTGAWHVADDDPDCATPVGHDHSAHHERMARSIPAQAPSHCAICHWLQGFRTDSVATTTVAAGDTANSLIPALSASRPQRFVRVDVPSRAPPSPIV